MNAMISYILKYLFISRSKLGHHAAYLQIPIGLESDCSGLVDLIKRKAIYFEGENGETIIEKEIPEHLLDVAEEKRKELIGKVLSLQSQCNKFDVKLISC